MCFEFCVHTARNVSSLKWMLRCLWQQYSNALPGSRESTSTENTTPLPTTGGSVSPPRQSKSMRHAFLDYWVGMQHKHHRQRRKHPRWERLVYFNTLNWLSPLFVLFSCSYVRNNRYILCMWAAQLDRSHSPKILSISTRSKSIEMDKPHLSCWCPHLVDSVILVPHLCDLHTLHTSEQWSCPAEYTEYIQQKNKHWHWQTIILLLFISWKWTMDHTERHIHSSPIHSMYGIWHTIIS